MPGGRAGVGHVGLGREDAGGEAGETGGDDERPARALERGAERLDGAAIRIGSGREAAREGLVVLEREMDDPVGRRGAGMQALQVVDDAPVHLCAGRGDGGGRRIGAGQSDDPVTRTDELQPPHRCAPVRRALRHAHGRRAGDPARADQSGRRYCGPETG